MIYTYKNKKMAYYLDRNEIKSLRRDLEEKNQKLRKADHMKGFGWFFIAGPYFCVTLLFFYGVIGIIISVMFGVVTVFYCYFLFGKLNPYKLKKECHELESKIGKLKMNVARKKDKNIREKKKLYLVKEFQIRVNYTKEFLTAMNSWSIKNLEVQSAQEVRLLIEKRLKEKLAKFRLVTAVIIQKLENNRYALKLHVGSPDAHYTSLGYDSILIIEDLNLNFTELALVEYKDKELIKYIDLRISSNRPLRIKEQYASLEYSW